MTRQHIIEKTLKAINRLPEDKAAEISDFADFVLQRYEEHALIGGIQRLAAEIRAFDFLEKEDDIYSVEDLKEIYDGQG